MTFFDYLNAIFAILPWVIILGAVAWPCAGLCSRKNLRDAGLAWRKPQTTGEDIHHSLG